MGIWPIQIGVLAIMEAIGTRYATYHVAKSNLPYDINLAKFEIIRRAVKSGRIEGPPRWIMHRVHLFRHLGDTASELRVYGVWKARVLRV
jgi:hypothetical protein